jgi:hypothetical protein
MTSLVEYLNPVAGKRRPATAGATFEFYDPLTGEPWARVRCTASRHRTDEISRNGHVFCLDRDPARGLRPRCGVADKNRSGPRNYAAP